MSTPDDPSLLAAAVRRMDGISAATAIAGSRGGPWSIRLSLTEDADGWQAFRRLSWLRENAGEVLHFSLDWEVGTRLGDGVITWVLVGSEGTASVVAQRVRDELVWKRS
jgi:hypothetical protein